MRKLILIAFMTLLVLMISSTGQALWHDPKLKMYSDKRIYEIGETVTIFAENTGKKPIELSHSFGRSHIVIYNEEGEKVWWSPKWTQDAETLNMGDIRSWTWNQTYRTWIQELNDYGYYTFVKAPNYGEQVPEGKYTAYQYNVGSVTFWIGSLDYPGASDSHRQDNGHGDACLGWASNEHAKGREHAADS